MRVLFSTMLLAMAWYAAVDALMAAVAFTIARAAESRRLTWTARSALAVRLLPFAAATVVAAVLFAPAHLWLEPAESGETFGLVVYALAMVTCTLMIRSAWRLAGVAGAGRVLRMSLGALRRVDAAEAIDAYEVPALAGISLAGIFRPRVLVGRAARRALTPAELQIAIAHEIAHARARDNLKRVLMYCAPDLFAAVPAAKRLESRWRADAERLADAEAVCGDGRRASLLASALLKVARLGPAAVPPAPAWSTFHEPPLLESRVRRLLGGVPPSAGRRSRSPLLIAAIGIATLWLIGVPSYLHEVTEEVVRVLGF